MALENTTLVQLDSALAEFFDQKEFLDKCKSLREQVTIYPTGQECVSGDTEYRIPKLNWKEKIFLALSLWYMPYEEVSFTLNAWLNDHWGPNRLEYRDPLLTSKDMALGVILENKDWNEWDFHGMLHNKELNPIKVFLRIEYGLQFTCKPRETTRPRGYGDKGSMRPLHCPEPTYDYRKRLTQEQLDNIRFAQYYSCFRFQRKVELRLKFERFIS